MNKKQKFVESSKKILRVSFAAAISLSIAVAVGTFTDHDVSSLTIIAGSAWAEVAGGTHFTLPVGHLTCDFAASHLSYALYLSCQRLGKGVL